MSQTVLVLLASAGVILAIAAIVAFATRGSTLRDVEMRFSSPLVPLALRDEALNGLLAITAGEEYALTQVDGARLIFQRRHRPAWTIYVAALLGPIGWLALIRRTWVHFAVTVDEVDEGSAIVAEGTMTLRLQRALRGFFASS